MILVWGCELELIIINMAMTLMQDVIQVDDFFQFIQGLFEMLSNYMQVAVNAMYFTLGDSMYIFIVFAISYLTYTYTLFPIVAIIRRFFIKGGDN